MHSLRCIMIADQTTEARYTYLGSDKTKSLPLALARTHHCHIALYLAQVSERVETIKQLQTVIVLPIPRCYYAGAGE